MPPGGNQVASIAVGVNPQSSAIPQGGSTQITATVTKTNFAGAVTLSVTGAPASLTVNISQPPVTGAVASGVITLVAASATPPAVYNLTVQASANGVSSASVPFTVTVMAIGAYTISAASSGLALAQGASGSVQLTLTRDQFTSLVDLQVGTLPNNVTGTFAPNPVSGGSSTLTLAVGPAVPLGTYNLVIRGSSAGSPERNVSLLLFVGQLTAFTFSANPSPVTIARGTSRAVSISITRGAAFASSVALAVDGAPQGLTATVSPASVTGTASTLTLIAAANLAVGMYVLTIRAGAAGNQEQSLNLPVIVSAT